MAPEILRGEEYSLSADVYSFGVILWEIISRKQPFKELNAFAISYQVGTQGKRLQPPSESGEERQWWRSLLEKCCGEEGERRRTALARRAPRCSSAKLEESGREGG